MPLSRDFKKLIVARANTDPDFRKGLIIEGLGSNLDL